MLPKSHESELINMIKRLLLKALCMEYYQENEAHRGPCAMEIDKLGTVLKKLIESLYVPARFFSNAGNLSHSIDEFFQLPANTFLTNFRQMRPDAFHQLTIEPKTAYRD